MVFSRRCRRHRVRSSCSSECSCWGWERACVWKAAQDDRAECWALRSRRSWAWLDSWWAPTRPDRACRPCRSPLCARSSPAPSSAVCSWWAPLWLLRRSLCRPFGSSSWTSCRMARVASQRSMFLLRYPRLCLFFFVIF